MRQLIEKDEAGFVLHFGTKDVMAKREQKDGKSGFAVRYPDGYLSWSPEQAFTDAYRQNGQLSFGNIYDISEQGFRARRKAWPAGHFIRFLHPMNNQFLVHEYAAMEGTLCMGFFKISDHLMEPYVPTQADLCLRDWEVHPHDLGIRTSYSYWVAHADDGKLAVFVPGLEEILSVSCFEDVHYCIKKAIMQYSSNNGTVLSPVPFTPGAEIPEKIQSLGHPGGQYEIDVLTYELEFMATASLK